MPPLSKLTAACILASALGACVSVLPIELGEPPPGPDPAPSYRLLTGKVVGRVIDASTGQGLAGVTIRVQNVQPAASATTDESGAFVLPVVTHGKQVVMAEKAGFTAPPGLLIADVMPYATTVMAAFAMRPVVSSPTPTSTPRQWLRARFTEVQGVNADTSAFDTERRDGERDGPAAGGVFAMWREQNDYGRPHPRAFVVAASWTVGLAPPGTRDRALELRFPAPPTAGQRFALGTGAVSPTSAQLRYLEGYRFRKDSWAATGGSLAVTAADSGSVKLVFTAATMAPDPQGEDFQSEAAGTFGLDGEGVVLPQDQAGHGEASPPAPPSRLGGPDLNGIWTFALPDGTPTPIPACGAAYRQFVFEDPDLDGRDVAIRVREVAPPGSVAPEPGSWLLSGGQVGDHYEFTGVMPVTGADGRPSSVREAFRLAYDAATGMLVGSRLVGASVAEGGRGALPVALVRARFEPPPPAGCPTPSVAIF